MKQFNDEQYRAVMHRDGPMLVLAGPGTGKTAVIVGRTLHLIKDEHIDPYNILVLTFSRAAAASMQSRFFETSNISYSVTFGTFHATFYHILKRQGMYRTGTILTADKKSYILKKISKKTGALLHKDPGMLNRMIECISYKKSGNLRLLDEMMDDECSTLELVYDEYVKQCRQEGYIDFDDMINECLNALKGNEKILNKWRDRFRYILVDEFQDIDPRQYEVLKLLAGKDANIFCVGDDDQSIYSFRGSVPEIMREMTKDYPDTQIVTLKVNYRCPQEVVDHARKLIIHNGTRFDKTQICKNMSMSGCTEYRCFKSAAEEAQYCMDIIMQKLTHKDPDNTETMGILYRISQSADMLEELMKRSPIRYRRKDAHGDLYDKEWVRDIFAYLKLTLSDSIDLWTRILNRPWRGLSRENLNGSGTVRENMLKYHEDDPESCRAIRKLHKDIDFIKDMNCFGALNYILKGAGMYGYIKETYFKGRSEEFEESLNELMQRARIYGSIEEWMNAVDEDNVLMTGDDTVTDDIDVEFMTIHSSKGLEFDNVIMIGLQEGVFPGKQCGSAGELEEERRLFYVAMTRCRKRLWLLGRRKDDYGKRESRFLSEAGFDTREQS